MSIHQIVATSALGGGAAIPPTDFYFYPDRDVGNSTWGGYELFDPFSGAYMYPNSSWPTYNGSYTFADGSVGKVAEFNGYNQDFFTTNLNNNARYFSNKYGTGKAHLTVDIWFYPTNNNCVILSELGLGAMNSYHYSMIETDGNNKLWVKAWPGSYHNTNETINLNAWNHVHYVYEDGSSPTLRVKVNNGTMLEYGTNIKDGPVASTGEQHFQIGQADSTTGNYGQRFAGKLGHLRISNYLSPSTYDYFAPKFLGANTYSYSMQGLQFWFEPRIVYASGDSRDQFFSIGNDTYLSDKGPYNNHALLVNNNGYSSGGSPYSWTPAGNLYAVTHPKDQLGFFTFNQNIGIDAATIGYWAYIPSGKQCGMAGFFNGSATFSSFMGSGNTVYAFVQTALSGHIEQAYSDSHRDQWARYDVTMSTSDHRCRVYVNGTEIGNFNVSGTWAGNNNPQFEIASYGAGGDQPASGVPIGNMQYWNRALSAQEISDQFTATKSYYGLS